MELVYEGKAKRMYKSSGLYVMEFKDEVTAGDGAVRATAPGKGALAAETSYLLFRYVSPAVQTHLVDFKPPNALVVKPAEVLPVEVIVRFKAYGSILKRMPRLRPLQPLIRPLVEFHYKDDALHDPLIYPQEVAEAGIASDAEVAEIERAALAAAMALRDLYARADCDFVDVKLEFGKVGGRLVLVDEISGDTFRLLCNGEHLDKEYFRKTRDATGLVERYKKLLELTKSLLQNS
ncbi:phosphoribosylaminoimidazolesuccinocarboxamide synthase [Pyrobaculum sp.]|uniref:phosphoribosylaminoimidazolesuccinocarboxamide synthase n=1 Tax=Pyrobaculum sp. TaxID=2004705 RepID=UPI0031648A3B